MAKLSASTLHGVRRTRLNWESCERSDLGECVPTDFARSDDVRADVKTLLRHFKHSAFQWVNQPNCEHCSGGGTKFAYQKPASPGARGMVSRVEVYLCSNCSKHTEFPRYNDPKTLFVTRKGRCGEFANAFGAVLTALGIRARYVWDSTDHVWVEVLLDNNEWVHADPCENALDSPLMYEEGWGKTLGYVLAFDLDKVVDVTRRYSKKPLSELKRDHLDESGTRKLVLNFSRRCRYERFAHRQTTTRAYAVLFAIAELEDAAERAALEALAGDRRVAAVEEQLGRTTGSEEWKTARNEKGMSAIEVLKSLPGGSAAVELVSEAESNSFTTQARITDALKDDESELIDLTTKALSELGFELEGDLWLKR